MFKNKVLKNIKRKYKNTTRKYSKIAPNFYIHMHIQKLSNQNK